MMAIVYKDIIRGKDDNNTWVEAGSYKIVRWFDSNRLLIQLNDKPENPTKTKARIITIVNLGEVGLEKDYPLEEFYERTGK